MDDEVKDAIVSSLHLNGKHGPYAKARSEFFGNKCITFSLEKPVWNESDFPEPGTYVVLSGLTKKRAGWRAQQGRFFKPSDETQKR